MTTAIPERTKHGVIRGRDALFLNRIKMPNERQLVLTGDINTYGGTDENYKIVFCGVVHLSMTELDFHDRRDNGDGGSFCTIQPSPLIDAFHQLDSADKIGPDHKHYYFCTYDTVFEIVASGYELTFTPMELR